MPIPANVRARLPWMARMFIPAASPTPSPSSAARSTPAPQILQRAYGGNANGIRRTDRISLTNQAADADGPVSDAYRRDFPHYDQQWVDAHPYQPGYTPTDSSDLLTGIPSLPFYQDTNSPESAIPMGPQYQNTQVAETGIPMDPQYRPTDVAESAIPYSGGYRNTTVAESAIPMSGMFANLSGIPPIYAGDGRAGGPLPTVTYNPRTGVGSTARESVGGAPVSTIGGGPLPGGPSYYDAGTRALNSSGNWGGRADGAQFSSRAASMLLMAAQSNPGVTNLWQPDERGYTGPELDDNGLRIDKPAPSPGGSQGAMARYLVQLNPDQKQTLLWRTFHSPQFAKHG